MQKSPDRSGSLKARLCSTWSAASAWTVRPRRALRSSHSVAPRWPASPGSHRLSPEPRRTGTGTRQREEQILDPTCGGTHGDHVCTLSVALLRDERSENCTFVMSTSSSCSLATGENILRPCCAKHPRSLVYSAPSSEDAAVLLRNLSFSLKTVAHLTFSFLYLSWSTVSFKSE